jgi:hypothetical protein
VCVLSYQLAVFHRGKEFICEKTLRVTNHGIIQN